MAKQTGETKEEKNIVKKVKPASKAKKKTVRKRTKEPNRNKSISALHTTMKQQKAVYTHKGDRLSTLQAKFIDLYIETGNQRQAVIQAGYKVKNPDTQANQLLRIPKIADEINYLMEQHRKKSIATTDEILQFYTRTMRGEEKDQFGLDAPLSERIKAGNELAKRLIDIPNKLEANITKAGMGQATVTIALNWDGMEDNNDAGEEDKKEE